MGEWSRETYRDVYAGKYAAHWDAGKGFSPPVGRHISTLQVLLRLRGVRRVLDVGCGPGQVLRLCAAAGFEVEGTEVVDVLFDRQLRGYAVRVAELPRLPFPAASFDAVLAVDVLEHLEEDEVEPSIDELARVTRRYLLTEVSSNPFLWTLSSGERVDMHRTLRPWSWWAEKIGRRFVDVTSVGGVVAWVVR